MAFLDPELTNQALAKTGSTYQVPSLQSAPAPTPATPPPPPAAGAPAPVAQAKDPEPPPGAMSADVGKTGDASDGAASGLKTAGSMVDGMGAAAEKPDAMKKLGGLIGTVLSIYTGNEMGAVSGIASMKSGAGGKK